MDPAAKVSTLADRRTAPYDLFLGIPVHRAPQVVEDSALAEDGWVAVDHTTFATRFENVYAVGDVTSAPVPRVGAIAEGEARTLADVLIHQFRGRSTQALPGYATCYIEFGGSKVARFDANFLSGPKPFGSFTESSEAVVTDKVEFGASMRRRWFGIESWQRHPDGRTADHGAREETSDAWEAVRRCDARPIGEGVRVRHRTFRLRAGGALLACTCVAAGLIGLPMTAPAAAT